MNEAKVLDLIGKYFTGNMTPAEKEVLMQWVAESGDNRSFFEEMIELWSVSGQYDEPFIADIDAAWQRVEARLPGEDVHEGGAGSASRIIGLPRRWLLRVAAVMLLGLVAGYWWWQTAAAEPVIVATLAGEKQEVTLPDGSKVWLNENSELRYDPVFEERTVQLTGEGFFEVEHRPESPFMVEADQAQTVVLGTRFNVRAYPEEEQVEVTVQNGKVALQETRRAAEEVLLTAGQSGVYDKKKKDVKQVPQQISNAAAWKEQRLVFQDTPMREVLRALERYFDVKFEVENEQILNCRLSAPYDQPQLDEVMMTVEIALGLQIDRIEEGVYRIKGPGCATIGND